jgi:hypothetical protein
MKPGLTLEFIKGVVESQLAYHHSLLKILDEAESLEEAKRIAKNVIETVTAERGSGHGRSSTPSRTGSSIPREQAPTGNGLQANRGRDRDQSSQDFPSI